MAEDLSNLWGKFSLSEEECRGATVQEKVVEGGAEKGKNCLVRKMINRGMGKNTTRALLTREWHTTGSFSLNELGDNLWLVDFENEGDKLRILEGRPWVPEGNLFAVEDFDGLVTPSQMTFDTAAFWVRMFELPLACMNKEVGKTLGETVGEVEDVDTNDEGMGWGKFLRVRIRINLFKPLARGRMLRIKDRSYWIPFQYERLPRICFRCGLICHGKGVAWWEVTRGYMEKKSPLNLDHGCALIPQVGGRRGVEERDASQTMADMLLAIHAGGQVGQRRGQAGVTVQIVGVNSGILPGVKGLE
jgi:hypothetical protein